MALGQGKASVAVWHAAALLLTALYLVPIAYVVLVAITPDGEITGIWPSHPELDNFVKAFTSTNFVRFFFNSASPARCCKSFSPAPPAMRSPCCRFAARI